jgi:hypothetical protein
MEKKYNKASQIAPILAEFLQSDICDYTITVYNSVKVKLSLKITGCVPVLSRVLHLKLSAHMGKLVKSVDHEANPTSIAKEECCRSHAVVKSYPANKKR